MTMRNKLLVAALLAATLAVAASLLDTGQHLALPAMVPLALRWIAILLLAGVATERRSLTAWILVGMLSGAEFGHDWPAAAVQVQFLGAIFLRLIKVVIAPLLFAALVVGIAGHADLKKVGRLALKSLVYFEVVSTIAMLIGFAAITLSRAGEGVHVPLSTTGETLNAAPHTAAQIITDIFPENIAKSVAEGQVLQVVVFSVLFGMALALVPEAKRRPMLVFAESLASTMFKFTNLVMYVAPIGVFGAVAYTVGHMGLGVLLPLFKLIATMYIALIVFILGVLLPIVLLARVPIKKFIAAVTEPVTIAFATASSEATLPLAIEEMEKFGVPRETVAFVLPTGYSFNMDGAAIYQSLALLFVVQAAGLHWGIWQQAVMLLTLKITSKGTAGVARGSLVVVFAAAATFHLPAEPLFLLLAIDQIMDMGRTVVSVLGNCVACVVIARWEGEIPSGVAEAAVDAI
jgi:proton glutamate symport protein